MGAPTDEDVAAIVAAIEGAGMNVTHADKDMHYGRMITIVVDEGDPDKITVFEIWAEGFMADQIAEKAFAARAEHGPGMVYGIGESPITGNYVPVGWDTTLDGRPVTDQKA